MWFKVLTFLLISVVACKAFATGRAEEEEPLPDRVYNVCNENFTNCLGAISKSEVDGDCVQNRTCVNVIAFQESGSSYKFHLLNMAGADYVGMGFSDDQDMGSDAVILCIKDDNKYKVIKAYNEGRTTENVNSTDGISEITTTYDNGIIYCTVTLTGSDLDFGKKKVSLAGKEGYYLIGAAGSLKNEDGNVIQGVAGHHRGHLYSAEKLFKSSSNAIVSSFIMICLCVLINTFE